MTLALAPRPRHRPAAAPPTSPATATAPILEARALTKQYRMPGEIVEAVRGVSLAVMPGEFVALMGPSGSGKSTLLQLLGGLDQPTAGEVFLEGEAISRLSDDAGDPAAPRANRLRVPVVQPRAAARRRGERGPAVHDRGPGPAPRRAAPAGSATPSPWSTSPARSATGPTSCPRASSSGSRSPGRSSPARPSCSPTSPPATSTSRPASTSSRRSGGPAWTAARRSSS